MSPDDIRFLYDYNAWANRRSLDAAAALTVEQFTKPLGSSFSSVRDTLAHIWGCEWLWLERFQGRSPASLPDVRTVPRDFCAPQPVGKRTRRVLISS